MPPTTPVGLEQATNWQALAPATEVTLSLAQVRMVLRALLPQPVFDLSAALALLSYHQRRKAASYRSHRKRTLRPLDELRANVSL